MENATNKMNDVTITISPICVKDGKKFAYVTFADGDRLAEGKIPDCTMISNNGFTPEEIQALIEYMRSDLDNLKSISAELDVIGAVMKG